MKMIVQKKVIETQWFVQGVANLKLVPTFEDVCMKTFTTLTIERTRRNGVDMIATKYSLQLN